MKKYLLYFFLILLSSISFSFAQDKYVCEKIVIETINAINTKNASGIENYLADDFIIAGQKGQIAKMVLPQLLKQLNDSVVQYQKVSEDSKEILTLIYDITYARLGKKTSKFIFDTNSKLLEIELFNLEIKTLKNNTTTITYPEQDYIQIPFKKVGNLILVEAELNGIKRNFLLDNGSSKFILNSHYTNSKLSKDKRITNIKGVNGFVADVDITQIKSFDFYGIKMENQDFVSVDLEQIEKSQKTTIYGLIGYEIYKDYDLLFDYKSKLITLIKPTQTDIFITKNYNTSKLYEFPIEMNKHLATVKVLIGADTLKMGIDCGAESNLLDEKYYNLYKSNLEKVKIETLGGADKIAKKVYSGKLEEIKLGSKILENSKTVFSDISHLNEGYKVNLDGLLGYELLAKQKIILSYINNKLIFID